MKLKFNFTTALSGILIGTVNGLFGAGGGIIAVPFLEKSGLSKKQAHANAVAVILPISVLSGILYVLRDKVEFSDASPFILWGILGSALGTLILKKISPVWLKKIFGIFVVYAGARLLLK